MVRPSFRSYEVPGGGVLVRLLRRAGLGEPTGSEDALTSSVPLFTRLASIGEVPAREGCGLSFPLPEDVQPLFLMFR